MNHDVSFNEPKSLEQAQATDRICDEFEADWQSGRRPDLESYLKRVAEGPVVESLLHDLLLIEVQYRGKRNETISVAQYLERLPEHQALIQRVLATVPDTRQEDDTRTFGGADARLEQTADYLQPGDATGRTLDHTGPVSPGAAAETLFLPGGLLGDYQLLEELGRGGMGLVFQARQISAGGRLVALKLIRPDRLASVGPDQRAEFLSRFRVEALAAAKLEHDHVLPVYDVGQVDGVAYFSMRYVPGKSLDRLVKDAPLANRVAARYIRQVAEGLAAAHSQGILHRDLKPHNVLIDSATDRALLTDFGLAKISEQDQQLTATEAVFGSPPYMSPEQAWNARQATELSDVYSLGATLYHVLTSRPPFQAPSMLQVLTLIKESDAVSPVRLNPSVDRDLNAICLKCLEKDPKRRYASARALADDLQRYLDGQPIAARPLGPLRRGMRWCRRRPLQAATMLLAGLVAISAAVGWHLRTRALDTQKLADAQRARADAEQLRAQAAESARRVADYHAALQRAREENASRRIGWTFRSLDAIQEALANADTEEQREQLQAAAVAPLVAIDLRPAGEIDTEIKPGCLAFDPQGRWMAVAELKSQAWVAACRVLLKALTSEVSDLVLQAPPDLVWAVRNGRQDGCCKIAFARDGSRLAVGMRSGKVLAWNLDQPSEAPLAWQAHRQAISRLEFGASGDVLFTYVHEDAVCRWQLGSQSLKTASHTLRPTSGRGMAYAAGVDRLMVRDVHLRVLDTELLSEVQNVPPGFDIADVSADGRFVLSLAGDGALHLVSIDGELSIPCRDPRIKAAEPLAHDSPIHLGQFVNAAIVLSVDKHDHVKLWDRLSGRSVAAVTLPTSEAKPAMDAAGRRLGADNGSGITLFELRGLDRPLLSTAAHHSRPLLLAAPGAQAGTAWVMTQSPAPSNEATSQTWCKLVQLESGNVLRRVAGLNLRRDGWIEGNVGLTVRPGGDSLAFLWQEAGATVFDAASSTTRPLPETGTLRGLRFSPAGDRLWAIVDDLKVVSWSFPGLKTATSWDNSAEVLLSSAPQLRELHVGSTLVVAAVRDGSIRLFSAEDGQPIRRLAGPGGELVSVALSPDEAWLAVGTRDGNIRVMNGLEATSDSHDFVLHADTVTSLTFSPDGRWLVSAGRDGAIHAFDLGRGEPRLAFSLPAHEGPIDQLAFDDASQSHQYRVDGEAGLRLCNFSRLRAALDEVVRVDPSK